MIRANAFFDRVAEALGQRLATANLMCADGRNDKAADWLAEGVCIALASAAEGRDAKQARVRKDRQSGGDSRNAQPPSPPSKDIS